MAERTQFRMAGEGSSGFQPGLFDAEIYERAGPGFSAAGLAFRHGVQESATRGLSPARDRRYPIVASAMAMARSTTTVNPASHRAPGLYREAGGRRAAHWSTTNGLRITDIVVVCG